MVLKLGKANFLQVGWVFLQKQLNIGGVGEMLVVGWSQALHSGSLWTPSCGALRGHLSYELCFGKCSRSLTLVQLVSPQGFPGKGASTVLFWGDSAHRRCPAVPVQSPLSYSRTDWPAVSVGFIWPGLEYICCRQNTTRKQCKNPSQAIHWSPW